MKNVLQVQGVALIIIIISLLLSGLTACSSKDQSVDRKGNAGDTQNQASVTPTQAVGKDITPTASAAPTASPSPAAEEENAVISSAPSPDTISIKYIGNSCFYITFQDGTRLVTDPYGTSYEMMFGKLPTMEADVVCISHGHDDHTSGLNLIKGNPKVIREDCIGKTIQVGKVTVKGYKSEHVAAMGDNIIFVFRSGDYKLVAMGETDNIKSKAALKAIKGADVLLVYAGEYGDIKNAESFKTLKKLDIKAFIPQHYSDNPKLPFYHQPTIDKILTEVPDGMPITETNEFIVSKDLKQQFVNLKPWGGF